MAKILNVTIDGDLKQKIKWKLDDAKGWVLKNKEMLTILTPILVSGSISIIKIVGKRHNLKSEKDLKELYCYDRSLGHYWRIKRNLSNREWLEINRRKHNGENLADILNSMRVLK